MYENDDVTLSAIQLICNHACEPAVTHYRLEQSGVDTVQIYPRILLHMVLLTNFKSWSHYHGTAHWLWNAPEATSGNRCFKWRYPTLGSDLRPLWYTAHPLFSPDSRGNLPLAFSEYFRILLCLWSSHITQHRPWCMNLSHLNYFLKRIPIL